MNDSGQYTSMPESLFLEDIKQNLAMILMYKKYFLELTRKMDGTTQLINEYSGKTTGPLDIFTGISGKIKYTEND